MTIGIYLTKRKPVSTHGCQVGVTNEKKPILIAFQLLRIGDILRVGARVQFAPIERLFLIIVSVV
jgi:hypothetical protein